MKSIAKFVTAYTIGLIGVHLLVPSWSGGIMLMSLYVVAAVVPLIDKRRGGFAGSFWSTAVVSALVLAYAVALMTTLHYYIFSIVDREMVGHALRIIIWLVLPPALLLSFVLAGLRWGLSRPQ
ncbi:hypothetical protein [Henriciella litoralis]|uniref:hypothetical protein n=1 Tax=Henriciella litoralis TaxID=568102 RepID=UPI000A026079|nr:hypothetical protein [Henriciella litoralis]